jgi:nucleoside-diphosphate kinase
MKLMRIDEAREGHYAEHEGKPFFAGLVEYITSAPVLAMVFDGPSAIQAVRAAVGATNPAEATPGSIRGDFGLERGKNLVHASDSVESGQRESALFFSPEEILDWQRDSDAWIHE